MSLKLPAGHGIWERIASDEGVLKFQCTKCGALFSYSSWNGSSDATGGDGSCGTGVEQDWHVWKKPETDYMEALYTISEGQHSICVDLTLDDALGYIREHLEAV